MYVAVFRHSMMISVHHTHALIIMLRWFDGALVTDELVNQFIVCTYILAVAMSRSFFFNTITSVTSIGDSLMTTMPHKTIYKSIQLRSSWAGSTLDSLVISHGRASASTGGGPTVHSAPGSHPSQTVAGPSPKGTSAGLYTFIRMYGLVVIRLRIYNIIHGLYQANSSQASRRRNQNSS
jgi:hypothetical protein